MELYQRYATVEGKRKLQSPFWWASWTDPVTGERHRVSTGEKSKRVAERRAEQIKEDSIGRRKEPATGAEVTLGEALANYEASLTAAKKASATLSRHHRLKTIGQLPTMAGRYFISETKPLHELEPIDLERLVNARRSEGNAPATICHEIKNIRAATRHAAALRQRVPTMLTDRSVKNPWRMPAVTVKTRYLSWDEWLAVYAYMDPERAVECTRRTGTVYTQTHGTEGAKIEQRRAAQDILVALTLTGGRWGEVRTMTWDRVDATTFKTVRLWGNKTQEERLVPVPEQVEAMLRRRYAVRNSHLIFPGKGGNVRAAGSFRPIIRAMNACGLNRPDIVAAHGRAVVHSLRHTFASWLLQNEADLAEVQDALGHKSLQMTRRYAHLSKGTTAQRLGGILSSVAGDMGRPATESAGAEGLCGPLP